MYGVFDCSFYRVAEDLEVIAPLLKKHGIAGVSIPAHCLNSRGDALRARRLIEENGLRWGLMPTPVDMYAEQTDDNTFSDALHTLERWAENAQLAGVSRAYNHVHPGSNTRPFEQNFSWYRERIAAVQEIMKRFHIFYGLEFVGPKHLTDSFRYPFLHDLQGVRSLADQVDPSVGILFDLFHWYTGGGTQEDILWVKAHPERIVAVHVNDAIAGGAREAQLDNERAMPMTNGVIDAVGILRIFAVGGYDGPVLCEPMDPCYTEFETMQPEQVVLCLKEAYDRLWNNERKAGE